MTKRKRWEMIIAGVNIYIFSDFQLCWAPLKTSSKHDEVDFYLARSYSNFYFRFPLVNESKNQWFTNEWSLTKTPKRKLYVAFFFLFLKLQSKEFYSRPLYLNVLNFVSIAHISQMFPDNDQDTVCNSENGAIFQISVRKFNVKNRPINSTVFVTCKLFKYSFFFLREEFFSFDYFFRSYVFFYFFLFVNFI